MLGGPLVGEGGAVLVLRGTDERATRDLLAADPWYVHGVLRLDAVKRGTSTSTNCRMARWRRRLRLWATLPRAVAKSLATASLRRSEFTLRPLSVPGVWRPKG